jgi:hypothetical protein
LQLTQAFEKKLIAMVSDNSVQSEKSMLGYKVAALYSNDRYRDHLGDLLRSPYQPENPYLT